MKRLWPVVGVLIGLFALPAPVVSQGAALRERGPKLAHRLGLQTPDDLRGARVIVKFKTDGALAREVLARTGAAAARRPQHAARLSQRLGLSLSDGRVVMPYVQVLHSKAISSAELVARLAQDPDVEYVEVDQRVRIQSVPNDPLYPDGLTSTTPAAGQWYLRPPTPALVSAIDAQSAWDVTLGSPGVVVAVLDTGVRYDHPDLAAKLLPGWDFIADPGIAADSNGWDGDPSDPGDWVVTSECSAGSSAEPSSWHGTQISGLIGAATNDGAGMAGVGRNVMILPVRVLGKCGGFQSDIVAAMRWAAGLSSDPVANAHPARVINMSLGSPPDLRTPTGCSDLYRDAVTELTNAGVVVVVPAGNEAGLAADQPARCAGAIGVSGLRHAGTKVGYSNVGPEIAIAAPAGNCVNVGANDACLYPLLTTTNSGTSTPVANSSAYTDSFNATLGTSFSAPLVAGTVALMLSANPSMTVAQVRQTLQATARPFPTSTTDPSSTATAACHAPNGVEQLECFCTASTCGAGMLHAAAAVARAAGFAPPTALIAVTPSTPVAGTVVSLDGSLSSAASGRSITSYAWAITSGAAIAQFSSATKAPTATVATSGAGTFSVRLTVTDSSGASAATDVTVTVVAPTTAGIAVTPSAPIAGTAVTLDGSPSVAASGRSITSYAWAITSGAAIASLSGPASAPTATVATSGAGNFSVRLTVTDSSGATAAADVTVTVTAPGGSGGGSGGGAFSLAWVSALALAALSLARRPRRR